MRNQPKEAQCIADEYEKAARAKRTLKQLRIVLDRLHEELSGDRVVRATIRSRVASWLPEFVELMKAKLVDSIRPGD